MQRLTTDTIVQACRIFLPLAYPGGSAAVPPKKRCVLELPAGIAMVDHLPGDAALRPFCQMVHDTGGRERTLSLRLGCRHYANLKLKAQLVGDDRDCVWVFSVDTHDAFSTTRFLPPPDAPGAAEWMAMQSANVVLKEQIEAAWEQHGLMTFNGLLRRDLQTT